MEQILSFLSQPSCSQQNVNLGKDAVFQCVMIMYTAIPNILGVNILLKVDYPWICLDFATIVHSLKL